jgi:hypothetical protein
MERPILFSGPMVRAILDGRKTQTRRVVKFPNGHQPPKFGDNAATIMGALRWYAQPGDRLWVRETFITGYDWVNGQLDCVDEDGNDKPLKVWYRATDPDIQWTDDDEGLLDRVPWKPSIHMPRKYCRLTLEVVNVRVERLQDISAENCMAEGIDATKLENTVTAPRLRFYNLWESINAKRAPWASNPWVWVIEFAPRNGSERRGE